MLHDKVIQLILTETNLKLDSPETYYMKRCDFCAGKQIYLEHILSGISTQIVFLFVLGVQARSRIAPSISLFLQWLSRSFPSMAFKKLSSSFHFLMQTSFLYLLISHQKTFTKHVPSQDYSTKPTQRTFDGSQGSIRLIHLKCGNYESNGSPIYNIHLLFLGQSIQIFLNFFIN